MTTEVQWSELQRDPKSVAALVDERGDVRVRRRDGAPLMLSREDRIQSTGTGSIVAARALRNALAHMTPEVASEVLVEEFPWLDLLSAEERVIFVGDFVRAVQASAELGVWDSLARTITEWKATAAVHDDPGLAARLRTPIDGDFGPVPNPHGE